MKVQKDDLQELMALLPSSIRTTKEFTTKTKMVIAQLILMNGLDKVKNDGYEFAIVRIGYRGYGVSGGQLCADKAYYDNIVGAQKAGLDVGVIYSLRRLTNRKLWRKLNL